MHPFNIMTLEDSDEPMPGGWAMANVKQGVEPQLIRNSHALNKICVANHIEMLLNGDNPDQRMVKKLLSEVCNIQLIEYDWPSVLGWASIWITNTDSERTLYFKHLYNRVYTSNSRGHPNFVEDVPNMCPVCHSGPISAAHIRGGCTHPLMRAEYIYRHNNSVERQVHAMKKGSAGNRHISSDCGKKSLTTTIPAQTIHPNLYKDLPHPINWTPDCVIINNLDQYDEVRSDMTYDIQIIETAIVANEKDIENKTYEKIDTYYECAELLRKAGHKVDVQPLIFGARIPIQPRDKVSFESLSMTESQYKLFHTRTWHDTLKFSACIHRLYKKLESEVASPPQQNTSTISHNRATPKRIRHEAKT